MGRPARKQQKTPGKDRVEIRLRIIEAICDARAKIGMYGETARILEEADAFFQWIVEEE